jgi:hypothetical protein
MPIALPDFFVAMLVEDEIESILRHSDPVEENISVFEELGFVVLCHFHIAGDEHSLKTIPNKKIFT